MRNRARGFYLITTLLILVVVFLVVVAAATLIPAGSAMAVNLADQAAAVQATESGLQYAMNRLQQNPTWRGNGPGLPAGSPDGSLVVIEDTGNVFGFIRTPDGTRSMFRIRFNYQDGLGSEYGGSLPNPATFVPSQYVSLNNLNSPSPTPVPRADAGGNWAVGAASVYDCPRYTACVIVEGLAGDGLREVGPGNPNPSVSNRTTTVRVAEAYFQRPNADFGDSALLSAGGILADLQSGADAGRMVVGSDDSATPARVRTNKSFTIQNPASNAQYVTPASGEVKVGPNTATDRFTVQGPAPPVTATNEDSSAHFPQLSWSSLDQADPSADLNLDAGTYVWRSGQLEYYAQEYTGTVPGGAPSRVITTSSDLDPAGGTILVNTGLQTLIFKKDVYVRPVAGGIKGVAIIPEDDTSPTRPHVYFDPPPTANIPILTAQGDVSFVGELTGKGSVTSEGDITFQGPSLLEADPATGVAIYAQGDINILAIPDAVVTANPPPPPFSGAACCAPPPPPPPLSTTFGSAAYADVWIGGVLYAQGNINADLITPANQGNLHIKGVAVAYGGDPSTQNPGENLAKPGLANLNVKNAEFVYDPSYTSKLRNLNSPTPLVQTFFHQL